MMEEDGKIKIPPTIGVEQFRFDENEHGRNHAPQCQGTQIPHVDQGRWCVVFKNAVPALRTVVVVQIIP